METNVPEDEVLRALVRVAEDEMDALRQENSTEGELEPVEHWWPEDREQHDRLSTGVEWLLALIRARKQASEAAP